MGGTLSDISAQMHAEAPSRPLGGSVAESPRALGFARVWERVTSARGELVAALCAGGLLLVGLVLRYAAGGEGAREAATGCSWVALGIGLLHGARAAWESLSARAFDIDVLMVVGAVLAAVMGAPGEGALLLFLFVLAGALEALAAQRTARSVEALHALMPTRALRLREGTEEAWDEVAPERLERGDVVKVLPGESIPADATVMSVGGAAASGALCAGSAVGLVNQASLTGESVPREVAVGAEVFAGTINVGAPLVARIARPTAQSSLQRILNLVIEAQQQREPVQRFIDRFSQPYAVGVMVVSVVVFLVWWRVFGAPVWAAEGSGETGALYVAITLLIVASPCAMIIATPTAALAGISRGARQGVLFKGGQAIERLARLRAVAFDKTGTLTVGRPRVKQIHAVGWSDEVSLLAVAAGLETESTHPIATAIIAAAKERGIEPMRGVNHGFTVGRGVSAEFDGKPARLGNLVFTEELIPMCLRQRVKDVLRLVQQRGEIASVVVHDQQAAVIVLADVVRPGAETLVRELHRLGVAPVVMLTGDNELTGRAVAEQLRINRVFAQLLPGDKVAHVERMKRGEIGASETVNDVRRRRVFTGVIGDGVNDAPALSAADVSIAIGSVGSDAALESADIVLLSDDLAVVPWAVRLARRVRRTIAINFTLALVAMVGMAVWTLVGSRTGYGVPLWVGVLAHEGGTLLVVLNSLLLLASAGLRGDAVQQASVSAGISARE